MKRFACMLITLLLLMSCASAEIQMYAVNVGKGDAILLMAEDYACLIDTGKEKAESAIRAAMESFGVERLDAVFITHCDKDHSGGLKWLRDMDIGAIYASKYHPEKKEKKHPAVKAAKAMGLNVEWLSAGDAVLMGENAILRVYAPETEIPDDEDENSLVMLLDSPDGRILLAGDMESIQEAMLLSSGQDLACDVLKVPNHGDDDACGPELIHACEARIAVISTDSREKKDTPSEFVLKNLKEAGCEIFVTQEAAGILVKMNSGEISAEYVY